MLKRHEIQVLRRAGHNASEVASLAGVSRRSVARVETEVAVTHVDTAAEIERRGVGRPSKAEPFRGLVVELLSAEPTLLSVEILRRARLVGYTGSKSALYELIASLRPAGVPATMRFEGLPGEFSQHDFGQVDVRYLDGRIERVHFFASRLKWSRWVEVTLVEDETAESLIRTLLEHFVGFRRRAAVRRLRSSEDGGAQVEAQRRGDRVESRLRLSPPWRSDSPPRCVGRTSPQQKGAVENLVKWVKGSFFKQRRFVDRADLAAQLAEWRAEMNLQRPNRATGVIPGERMAEERPRLRSLRITAADLALRLPVSVGPTAVVVHDTHSYSMPPETAGFPATLYLYRDRVRIVAGRFEAVHPRQFSPHAVSRLPEHRAQHLAAISGRRGKRYLKRQHLFETGEAALISSPRSCTEGPRGG